MSASNSPHPACPKCGSAEVFEIVHDQAHAPEIVSTQSWVFYEGACDINPDKWKCGDCDFRWYPRKIVERDLDLLTWQLEDQGNEKAKTAIRERLTSLRKMISILARADAAG